MAISKKEDEVSEETPELDEGTSIEEDGEDRKEESHEKEEKKGILSRIFKKKDKSEAEEKPEEEPEEKEGSEIAEDISEKEEPEEKPEEEEEVWVTGQMVADIERTKAQFEASKEISSAFNERILGISENVGQIRNMFTEQEKHIEQIELKATKASDLVEEVKPQQILADSKNAYSKIDILSTKMDSLGTVNQKITDDLKDIKQEIKKIRSLKQTIELNQEIRKEIMTVKRNIIKAESDASLMNDISVQTKKRFAAFDKVKKKARKIEKYFEKAKKELEETVEKTDKVVTKADLDEAKSNISNRFNNLQKKFEGKSKEFKELKRTVEKYDQKLGDRGKNVSWLQDEIKKVKKIFDETKKMKKDIEANHNFALSERQVIQKKIHNLESNFSSKEAKLKKEILSVKQTI